MNAYINSFKNIFCKASNKSIIRKIANKFNGNASILLYHRILPELKDLSDFEPNLDLIVTCDKFEEQISYLSKNYKCLHINEAVNLFKENKLKKYCIVVTFDDGYRDNLKYALPILKKYNVPATIYITTGIIDKTCILWWYELESVIKNISKLEFTWDNKEYRIICNNSEDKYKTFRIIHNIFRNLNLKEHKLFISLLNSKIENCYRYNNNISLSWDELVKLSKEPLISIGIHTVNHPVLKKMSKEEIIEEISESRKKLESMLNEKINHFAYPYGTLSEISERDFEICKNINLDFCVTTEVGHLDKCNKKNLFYLPRIPIVYFDDFNRFITKIGGFYSLFKNLKKSIL